MAKKRYTLSSKHGRTALQNNTNKFVTHLLQNEKWLNDQIGEMQQIAEACKADKNMPAYQAAVDKVASLVAQHRLFVSEFLPYCMPKLSAVMGSDSGEALDLLKQLMDIKEGTSDSSTGQKETNLG